MKTLITTAALIFFAQVTFAANCNFTVHDSQGYDLTPLFKQALPLKTTVDEYNKYAISNGLPAGIESVEILENTDNNSYQGSINLVGGIKVTANLATPAAKPSAMNLQTQDYAAKLVCE